VKLLHACLLLAAVLMLNACIIVTDTPTQVRVQNDVENIKYSLDTNLYLDVTFYNMTVDDAVFATITPGQTTEYKEISLTSSGDVTITTDSVKVLTRDTNIVLTQVRVTLDSFNLRNITDFVTNINSGEDNTVIVDTSVIDPAVLSKMLSNR
jgi:hypothetical protein